MICIAYCTDGKEKASEASTKHERVVGSFPFFELVSSSRAILSARLMIEKKKQEKIEGCVDTRERRKSSLSAVKSIIIQYKVPFSTCKAKKDQETEHQKRKENAQKS